MRRTAQSIVSDVAVLKAEGDRVLRNSAHILVAELAMSSEIPVVALQREHEAISIHDS